MSEFNVWACGECNAVEARGDKHQPWCSKSPDFDPNLPKFELMPSKPGQLESPTGLDAEHFFRDRWEGRIIWHELQRLRKMIFEGVGTPEVQIIEDVWTTPWPALDTEDYIHLGNSAWCNHLLSDIRLHQWRTNRESLDRGGESNPYIEGHCERCGCEIRMFAVTLGDGHALEIQSWCMLNKDSEYPKL